jgi:hypothetical protein
MKHSRLIGLIKEVALEKTNSGVREGKPKKKSGGMPQGFELNPEINTISQQR